MASAVHKPKRPPLLALTTSRDVPPPAYPAPTPSNIMAPRFVPAGTNPVAPHRRSFPPQQPPSPSPLSPKIDQLMSKLDVQINLDGLIVESPLPSQTPSPSTPMASQVYPFAVPPRPTPLRNESAISLTTVSADSSPGPLTATELTIANESNREPSASIPVPIPRLSDEGSKGNPTRRDTNHSGGQFSPMPSSVGGIPIAPRRSSISSSAPSHLSSSVSTVVETKESNGKRSPPGLHISASQPDFHPTHLHERRLKGSHRRMSNHQEMAKNAVNLREIAKKIGRAHLVWEAPPRTVLIVTKFWDVDLIRKTHFVTRWLIDCGMTVLVEDRLKEHPAFDYTSLVSTDSEDSADSPTATYTITLADLERAASPAGSDMAFSTPPETPTTAIFMHTEHHHFQHQLSRSLEPDSASTATSATFNSHRVNSNVSSDASSNGSQLRFWDTAYCSTQEAAEEIDFIITLGGDGTVLFAAWLFQQKVPPIIPFHLGSLGFLTVFEFTKFRSSITRILQDNHKGMRMNFRLRFACTVYRRNDGRSSRAGGLIAGTESSNNSEDDAQRQNDHGRTYHILNDLVVDRGPSPYVSQLELYGNDKHLTTVQADGLAVSTPTGSTAYSLSAGGAVVHPDVSAILVTPICPHTLSFRPMILPDTMDLRIMVPPDSRATAWASFDGRHRVQLQPGDCIQVLASRYPVPTVCSGEDQSADWFESLERCLGWNKRERQKALEPATEESVMRGLRDDEW